MRLPDAFRPFAWGIAVGALAITIVGFSTGFVVTATARDKAARTASVMAQAGICASLAQAHRKAAGDTTDLTGYRQRPERNELAKSYAVALPGSDEADARVVSECSDLLDPDNT